MGQRGAIVGEVTNSEWNAANCVSLPMFPELTQDEIDLHHGKSPGVVQSER